MRSGLAMGSPERYHWASVAAKRGSGNAQRKRVPFATGGTELPEWQELITRATRVSEIPIAAEARVSVGVWLQRLEEWNKHVDLTAARSPDELVDLLLADALFLAPRVASDATVIDVGSGAGAPGLALALLSDGLRLTLVEPMGKRASFLRTVVGALGRTDIVIERARGESLTNRHAWDVAVSRATFPPPAWLALGAGLVNPGGRVILLLAKDPPPELPELTVESDESYVWPLTGVKRRAVVYRTAR
jgi:16S rRNA (guanine527-N7)-methyltransferase